MCSSDLGHDMVATRVLHARRGGPGLASPGLAYQDDGHRVQDRVVFTEEATGLVATNRTTAAVLIRTDGQATSLAPGSRRLLPTAQRRAIAVQTPAGQPVSTVSADGSELEQPIDASAGYGWIAWLMLSQLLVVALPEEAFFRGYVLSRLRTHWPPRRRIWGVPFGRAHVASALLFALVHLVVVPHPGRLLVFFPALVFAWLAERSHGALAPAVHHSLCNVALRLLQRCYV